MRRLGRLFPSVPLYGVDSAETRGTGGPMIVRLIEGDVSGPWKGWGVVFAQGKPTFGVVLDGFLRSMAIQVQERISDMVRISLSISAVALAVLASGCTLCDTCDDFPMPCAGGNCGVAMTSTPAISPFLGSYTPIRTTAATQPVDVAPPAPAGSVTPPGMSSAPPLPDEDPNPSSPDAPGVPAPNITTPPPAPAPGAETLPPSADPAPAPAAAPATEGAPKTTQIMLETETPATGATQR